MSNTDTNTAFDLISAASGVETAAPVVVEKPLRSVMENEVTLTAYATDLWGPGCKSAEDADKLISFHESEEDLDMFLALLMSQSSYMHAVKDAEDEGGAIIAPSIFLLPRVFFDQNSPMSNDADNVNIKTAALWFQYKYGVTDAEAAIRDMINNS